MSVVIVLSGLALATAAVLFTRCTVNQVAFLAVATLTVIISWNGIRFAGGSFANAFFIIALLTTGLCAAVERAPVTPPPWLVASALLLLASALINALSPPNPSLLNQTDLQFLQSFAVSGTPITGQFAARSNLSALVNWEVGLVLLPLVVATASRTATQVSRLLDCWVLGTTINAAVAVLDFAGVHVLAATPEIGHRSAGLTVHPNYLALTCLLGLPAATRMIRSSPRRTAAGLLATALLLAGEYASGSRAGAVTIVVLLLLCILLTPGMNFLVRYAVPLAAVLLGFALIVPGVGHSILVQTRLSTHGTSVIAVNGSDYQRGVYAHVATAQFTARPLSGVGMSVDNDAQNIYLQVLAAGGLVALAGLAILIGGIIMTVRSLLSTRLRGESVAVGLATLAWLINGVFDSQLADKYLYLLPGILIACARVAPRGTYATGDPGLRLSPERVTREPV